MLLKIHLETSHRSSTSKQEQPAHHLPNQKQWDTNSCNRIIPTNLKISSCIKWKNKPKSNYLHHVWANTKSRHRQPWKQWLPVIFCSKTMCLELYGHLSWSLKPFPLFNLFVFMALIFSNFLSLVPLEGQIK